MHLCFIVLLQAAASAANPALEEQLPEKLVTIVDKTLDDQFAQIEQLVAKLPDTDRGEVFLITLPLENFIEDIIFPTNSPVTVYPRIMFRVIRDELGEGRSKKEVANLLVRYQQGEIFRRIYASEKSAKE